MPFLVLNTFMFIMYVMSSNLNSDCMTHFLSFVVFMFYIYIFRHCVWLC